MSDTSIIPTDASLGSLRAGYENYPAGATPPTQDQASPLRMVHLFLRGRYWLLAILVMILTPVGAWIGYRNGKVDYQSRGEIRAQTSIPTILYKGVEDGPSGMFDQYMDAECATIMSRRCIEDALADPEWKKLPPGQVPDADTISYDLSVTRQGIRIEVAVTDPNRQVAATGVKTLVDAYKRISDENAAENDAMRGEQLDARELELAGKKQDENSQISNLAHNNPYGTDDLTRAYDDQFNVCQQIRLLLEQAKTAQGGGTAALPGQETGETLLHKIANDNQNMAQALYQRDAWQNELMQDDIAGLGPNNSSRQHAEKELDLANNKIEKYKNDYLTNQGLEQAAANSKSGGPTTQPALTIAEVVTNLQTRYSEARVTLKQIGDQMIALRDLKEQLASTEKDLDEVLRRKDELRVEHPAIGKGLMWIASEGDMSDRPHSDTHIAMAAVGGFGGFSVAALFVITLGLRDRRFHGPEDTQFSPIRCPMLGMLPTLTNDLSDTEQAAMAAHFVHGIRAMLQIKGNHQNGRVIAITSPSAHNGKTSVSLALGVSFAGAHSKTLLIDCDFIGRALSERLNAVARPRLGRVLREQGLIDENKLQEGLDEAVRHGKRLGEALVEMGHLATDKLDAALAAQKDHTFGVLEAINGEDLAECVAPTAIPGLSILPLGQACAEHIGSLSPAMLRQVLEATRQKYDVVIVDTGPILGSLEAAMVATQADDVVLVLSNGENRTCAERSLRYLESVGAKVAGYVFNRAPTRDFLSSNNALRMSSSADRWRHARNWNKSETLSEFGPVAQAVARSVGESESPKSNGHASRQNGNGHGKNGHAA